MNLELFTKIQRILSEKYKLLNNVIYNKDELIKTVNTKLEKTQWYSENENYGQWLLNLLKSIEKLSYLSEIEL